MRRAYLILAAALCTAASYPQAGEVPLLGRDNASMSLHVTSLKELRFKRAFRATVHQQYDFSCGSAALATLLTYHYGRPVTEQQVFQVMYQNGNQARIREVGFSM